MAFAASKLEYGVQIPNVESTESEERTAATLVGATSQRSFELAPLADAKGKFLGFPRI